MSTNTETLNPEQMCPASRTHQSGNKPNSTTTCQTCGERQVRTTWQGEMFWHFPPMQ